MVRARTTGGYHLIAKAPREGQVGETITVHVAQLFASEAVLDAPEPVRGRSDSPPRSDRFPDQVPCSLHDLLESRRQAM